MLIKKMVGAVLFLIVMNSTAWATHAVVGAALGHAGPITTTSASTHHKGKWSLEFITEFQKFDTFSDSRLLEFAEQGEEDVHNVDYLLSTAVGVAYGLSDKLTFHLRIPYSFRNDIREIHHEPGENGPEEGSHDIETLGDAQGLGDISVFGHYRFMKSPYLESAILFGLKMPTGKTSDTDDHGERFETEFQPGSGSWDPMVGLAVTKSAGPLSLDANILYTLVTKGSQDTDLGDTFNYNAAVSYRLMSGKAAWDFILEANGIWKDKEKTAGEQDRNSGGNIIFLSPGVRISLAERLTASLSLGIPVIQGLNGKQNEIHYRSVFGVSVML